MHRTLALLLAVVFACAALANGAAPVTTVILVRHAEKAGDATTEDPPLSEGGQLRARELARILGDAGVSAIYTTPFARTRDTAAPLAQALKITPVEMKTGSAYAGEMAARIRDQHEGETVLVIGHSNSTQQVIRALGIADAPSIAESTYDNLFVVTLAAGSEPRLLALRYGAVAR